MPGPLLGGVDAEQVAAAVIGSIVFISTVVAGVRTGIKKARDNEADPGMRIAGGIIMENQSMLMLSENLRKNTEAIDRAAQRHHEDAIEICHQIERLRDKMP